MPMSLHNLGLIQSMIHLNSTYNFGPLFEYSAP